MYRIVAISIFILSQVVSSAEENSTSFTETDHKDLHVVFETITAIATKCAIWKVEVGRFPDSFKSLEKVNELPPDSKVVLNSGKVFITRDGWQYELLTKNVYGDKYDNREVLAISVKKENSNSENNSIIFYDSVLGIYYKKFNKGQQLLVSQFCGVNGSSGIDGWVHLK